MVRDNKKKQHTASGRRHIRIGILLVAMLLAVTAAGCSKEPEGDPAWMSDPGEPFSPSGTGGRVTFTGTMAEISGAKVGDTVQFGSYEQDNNTKNGAEAIEWLVLDKQDGKLLLLSKDALDTKPYNKKFEMITWETCTLRRWLNNTFYYTAFSEEEQGSIVTTKVKNGGIPEYGEEDGEDTEDKVFLLSVEEILNYFDPDESAEDPARRARVTAYAGARGAYVSGYPDYAGSGFWWLRSSGDVSSYAASVFLSGSVECNGYIVDGDNKVVRPALWLDPEA